MSSLSSLGRARPPRFDIDFGPEQRNFGRLFFFYYITKFGKNCNNLVKTVGFLSRVPILFFFHPPVQPADLFCENGNPGLPHARGR